MQKLTKEEITAVFRFHKPIIECDDDKSWYVEFLHYRHRVYVTITSEYSVWFSQLSDKFTYEALFEEGTSLKSQLKQVEFDIDRWDSVLA